MPSVIQGLHAGQHVGSTVSLDVDKGSISKKLQEVHASTIALTFSVGSPQPAQGTPRFTSTAPNPGAEQFGQAVAMRRASRVAAALITFIRDGFT